MLNSSALLGQMTKETFENIQTMARTSPEQLEDTEQLEQLNDRYYCGSQEDGEMIFSELPRYGDFLAGSDKGLYIGGEDQALVKQVDFRFADDSRGSTFIVTRADAVIPQVRSLTANMLLVVVLILVVMALMLVIGAVMRRQEKTQS